MWEFKFAHDSQHKDKKSGQGFLKGPALFTVTDDLVITPISSISGLSVLSKLKVPFGDIEERTVHVGKNEALHLLLASLISKSALTNAFLLKKPKQEFEELMTSEGRKKLQDGFFDDQDGVVFVKGPVLLTISDELRVMSSSTSARISLFSKLGIKDTSTIEEMTFSMGVLECLIVSKTPLTEALLEQYDPALSLNNEQVSFRNVKIEEEAANEDGKIQVKLMFHLGLVSEENTAMLVNPKLAPGFSHEVQSLNIEKHMHQPYFISDGWSKVLTSDETLIPYVTGLSAVRKLKVPFTDIEEHIMHVGKEESVLARFDKSTTDHCGGLMQAKLERR
ncbi:hypothetical protein PTKIN_Ptkin11bG0038000 [Pterospermum kingtungense]